jgi:transposase-like protein
MPDWIQYISRGSLLYPSKQLIAATEVFNDIHKNSLSKDKFIFDTVTDRTLEKLEDKLPHEVIHCLARTRTYIRLREINTKISFDNCKKRLDRKMKKFTNLKK